MTTTNILNRQFTPAKPNQAWVADITHIWTQSGWLYLTVILDLFSRKVVGWAMSVTMTADLVCRALVMAIGARRPLIGLIVHTDRGSQYASHDYQRLLKKYGLIRSMSRKGNCWVSARIQYYPALRIEFYPGAIAPFGERRLWISLPYLA